MRNSCPSVSSVLLASLAATCNKKQDSMVGAATSFSCRNTSYHLPDDLIPYSYPFSSTQSMMLFGDYQYGAQRDFKKQLLFGAEDCSTSVGKATYLTTEQVESISTITMKAAYSNPGNEYHYNPVTFLRGDIKDEQLKLIQPGDIYLVRGHTAIIASNPDNKSNITTLQFNRDIDSVENKILGGGTYDYNLLDKVHRLKDGVYILRPNVEPLHESCSLNELLYRLSAKNTSNPDHL
ncbi:RP439 family protein [Rickettsia endosymbiont of Urophora cardui]|uniref:RP439 family protein n=1 Tax=Rickettsia endosymbiont of Urophora cardui TaxID=3066265 RepID=UPI00313E4039